MASTSASTLAASRPSEKFGTHSIRRFMGPGELLRSDSFAGVNDFPALDCHRTVVNTKIVRYFAVVLHIEDRQISVFANLNGTDMHVTPQGIGCIDRRRGDGLGGAHAHLRACKRHYHWEGERGVG